MMSKDYSTQNLYEAAYLLAKGFKLIGKAQHARKISIIFQGSETAQEAARFYNGATVSAKAYADSYRTLKDYIFER